MVSGFVLETGKITRSGKLYRYYYLNKALIIVFAKDRCLWLFKRCNLFIPMSAAVKIPLVCAHLTLCCYIADDQKIALFPLIEAISF